MSENVEERGVRCERRGYFPDAWDLFVFPVPIYSATFYFYFLPTKNLNIRRLPSWSASFIFSVLLLGSLAAATVFAWIFTPWALLAVTPVYVYMVRGLENAGFVRAEMEEVARLRAALPPPLPPPPQPQARSVATATENYLGAGADKRL